MAASGWVGARCLKEVRARDCVWFRRSDMGTDVLTKGDWPSWGRQREFASCADWQPLVTKGSRRYDLK
jgi:hypothetical protein